jgi:Ca2+-binding RTX toxin-like protein
MTLGAESVSLAGSGLVFVNSYDASVTPAFRDAIVAAENELQHDFTNQVTVNVDFSLAPLEAGFSAENRPTEILASYADLTAGLRANAATSDDYLAVNGLPATDPSGGAGFVVPYAQARILGLAQQTMGLDDSVVLNSNLNWSFGQDAVGAIEHEITEGVFGRISSLGVKRPYWAPMDLFRFTAGGQRDYTGGADGVTTYFGVDGSHVSALAYHNSVNAQGVYDGYDLADWNGTRGDAFGPGGPAAPGSLSATDLQVLDVLGWNPTPFTPAADDFASSLGDTSHPFGQLAPGAMSFGVLEQAGDRDWFQVTLQAGQTYAFGMSGVYNGDPVGGPFLRLHDAGGNLVLSDANVARGQLAISEIVYTAQTSGTYYVEAGAYLDGYAGEYGLRMGQTGTAATAGADFLVGRAGGDSLSGGDGADTLAGADGTNSLFGGAGDDWIFGGTGHNQINGNQGDDLIRGQSLVGDWLLGGQGNDEITAARSSGQNIINGNLGDDTLVGGSGGDTLRGGQGDDAIRGGSGADWISGDLGHNTLTGGQGADTFHASAGVDLVGDFNAAQGDHVLIDHGVQYTTSQNGADVLISLSNGGAMTLKNVTLSALPSDWLLQT